MKPPRHSCESGNPSPAEHLLTHFDRIADAPASIPHLRRFILDLAVRGKLVPQDPNDEPASELLKRIAVEKKRLTIAGNFKTHNSDFPRDDTDFSFSIPANWVWSYLDDISAIARGGSPRPIKSYLTDDPDGIPWIKIGDSVRGNIYIDKSKERIRSNGLTKSRLVVPGDLLLSNSMSFGYPYITNIEGCIHDGWLVIRTPDKFLDKLYLHTVLLSDHAKVAFSKAASGAVVQNLNADKVRLLPVPLPPLDEQHRIVAKIDELMALCDRLEAARTERDTTRNRLAAASLARLNEPDPDPTTFQDHAAFALENLTPLTTRPDQIKALRQTILNLAICGKLVEQDPNDEPAAEMLRRLATEKARLVGKKKIKGRRATKPAMSSDLDFTLPTGWSPANIDQVLIKIQTGPFGSSLHQSDYQLGGVPVVNPASIQNERIVPVDKMAVGLTTLARLSSFKLQTDDIVMARRGEMGRCAVVTERERGWLCGTGSLILQPFKCIYPRFLSMLIGSPFSRQYLGGTAVGTTMQNLNQTILLNLPFGLPPLAEQHRIVTMVDQMMALCDRLEESLATVDDTRRRLLDAVLHEALDPSPVPETKSKDNSDTSGVREIV